MLVTKYIIRKTSYFDGAKYLNGDVCYTYFAGQAGTPADGLVDMFDSRKKRAKRYSSEEEAISEMQRFKSEHNPIFFSFKVIPIRCRG
jgi:hypothetical protein